MDKYTIGKAYTIELGDTIIGFVSDIEDAEKITNALNNSSSAQEKLDSIMKLLGNNTSKNITNDPIVSKEVSNVKPVHTIETKKHLEPEDIILQKKEETVNQDNLIEKICQNPKCGKHYKTVSSTSKFCSQHCRRSYKWQQEKANRPEGQEQNFKYTRICQNPDCKKSFGTNFDGQVYCSKECRKKVDDQRVKEKEEKFKQEQNTNQIVSYPNHDHIHTMNNDFIRDCSSIDSNSKTYNGDVNSDFN